MASLDWNSLQHHVRGHRMLNKDLQKICVSENLNKTGVKAVLQQRIIDQLRSYAENNNATCFNRLRYMVENPKTIPDHGHGQNYLSMHSSSPAASSASVRTPTPLINGAASGYNGTMNGYRPGGINGVNKDNILFKPSPFFNVITQLGESKECLVMTAHRHTVEMSLRVSEHPLLIKVSQDQLYRVMIFCASEGNGLQDISFPHQSELKVHGGEVKANLRGLKNKPGSTRPVDITKELRLNIPAYNNKIEMTYALTNKKYYLCLLLVKLVPLTQLIAELQSSRRITKDSVVKEMVSKSRDADIVATASVLSLKCPLSTLRIDLPCRSFACRHTQCFDGISFLQLQEQGPTWMCPICNKPAPFTSLAVDEYVSDILKNTSKDVDQVTIQPNGVWELHNKPDSAKLKGVASASDDEDDLVEVTKSGESVKPPVPRIFGTPIPSLVRQQSYSSGTVSASASAPLVLSTTNGKKRPASVVIDLTSDDEEEQPRPPLKRQFIGFNPAAPAYRPPPGADQYR